MRCLRHMPHFFCFVLAIIAMCNWNASSPIMSLLNLWGHQSLRIARRTCFSRSCLHWCIVWSHVGWDTSLGNPDYFPYKEWQWKDEDDLALLIWDTSNVSSNCNKWWPSCCEPRWQTKTNLCTKVRCATARFTLFSANVNGQWWNLYAG